MKRSRPFVVAVFTLAVAMLGSSAHAADSLMRIDIPFAFSVEDATVPAGPYVLMVEGTGSARVMLKSGRTGELTRPRVVTRLADLGGNEPRFVFDTVGDVHYLAEIHIPGMDGYALQGAPVEHGHELVSGTN